MDARLQRRVQRYGWDLAADDYEPLWQAQLAEARAAMISSANPTPGNQVLDIACGTGLVSFEAARAVGPDGHVLGVDISARMLDSAERRARELKLSNCSFARMDAETLSLPDASFDVVLCALGLMYLPEPEQALREMRRVVRPGGRICPCRLGRTIEVRMVGAVRNRRCGGSERGLPSILSSRPARHPRASLC
jgi:ubiquinone/menaquinone biosynthesis C-methylase UbiE